MSIAVYTATLDAAHLGMLLEESESSLIGAIVERPDRLGFLRVPVDGKTWAAWPAGRAFGPEAEIVWKCTSSGFQVRYTGASPAANFVQVLTLGGLNSKVCYYHLWGPDDAALGRRLDYTPLITGSERPRLEIVEYRDTAGKLCYYRYRDIQPREEVQDDG
jgi:hypothetical protein